jgi:hypothetical protein
MSLSSYSPDDIHVNVVDDGTPSSWTAKSQDDFRCRQRDDDTRKKIVRVQVILCAEMEITTARDPAGHTSNMLFEDSEDDTKLKEWIWNNRKDELLANMKVCVAEKDRQEDETQILSRSVDNNRKNELYKKRLKLLDRLAKAQRDDVYVNGPKVIYQVLMKGVIDLFESEYGFLSEVRYGEDGRQYLHVYLSVSDGKDSNTTMYISKFAEGLKFYSLENLFGRTITTGKPVISNDPPNDPRSGGCPAGHPPLDNFLGIPVFDSSNTVIGMIALANRPGGFSSQGKFGLVDEFQIILGFACGDTWTDPFTFNRRRSDGSTGHNSCQRYFGIPTDGNQRKTYQG